MAQSLNKHLILCIEPAGELCLLLGMMLHRDDLDIQHVATMNEAANVLAHDQPVLIIIENSFAQNKLVAFIMAVKENAPESKMLMVSSVGDEVEKEASAAGIDVFLTKPFGKTAFVEAALSMLE